MSGSGSLDPIVIQAVPSTGTGSTFIELTLQEVLNLVRHRLNNFEVPYFWVDAELVHYCNTVIREFCRETLILHDASTSSICELFINEDALDYALAPQILYIHGARLVTEEVLILDTAPATAWVAGDTITGGTSGATCKIVSYYNDYAYIVTQRTGVFTLNESLTNGTAAAAQGASYPIFNDYKVTELQKTTRSNMDSTYAGWRAVRAAYPNRYLLDFVTGYFTMVHQPTEPTVVKLSVSRYPLVEMTTSNMTEQYPELPALYQDALINGICGHAKLKPDEQTYDQKQASDFLGLYKQEMSRAKIQNVRFLGIEQAVRPHGGFM